MDCFSFTSFIALEDFQSQNGILTFSSDVTESCVSIVIVNDSVRESVPECFTVGIVNATGDIDSPSVATVCISDNDGMCSLGHYYYLYMMDNVYCCIIS